MRLNIIKIILLITFCHDNFICCRGFTVKQYYQFTAEPIDVVIPAIEKDLATLNLCIDGIRQNGKNIRNIYVVSDKPLTHKARWFDEKKYPFSKYDIALQIFGTEKKARKYLKDPINRIGWILQQFLKLYAPFVIPGISSNILLLDADTIFLNPVSFLNEKSEPLFNPSGEYWQDYFDHAQKLIEGFKKLHRNYSGISHHMLIQKSVIANLFNTIESQHHMDTWKAFCKFIKLIPRKKKIISGQAMSEYEIYFNFILSTSSQGHIRPLKWAEPRYLEEIPRYKAENYDYVSCHTRNRGANPFVY